VFSILFTVTNQICAEIHSEKSIRTSNRPMGRAIVDLANLTESARKMLEGKNFVYLATVNPDGTPQVTPTWVDTDGKFVLVNTAIGRVKHRNVKQNPNVALAITDQNNPYNLVVIRGKVVDQLTGRVAEEHIDKMAKKYRGIEKYPNRSPGEQRVILKIEPARVISR